MEDLKRKRAANYSEFEMDILAELVHKYKNIIENKRTDGVTIKKKEETWGTITQEFNSIGGVSMRNEKNLKTCYENLKRKARKICADRKVHIKTTGGGSSLKPEISNCTEKIMALIAPTITPLMNLHDSDAMHQESTNEGSAFFPFVSLEESNGVDTDAVHSNNNMTEVLIMPYEDVDNSLTSSQADPLCSMNEVPANSSFSYREVQSSVTTPVQARHSNSRPAVAPANSSQTASFPSSYTDVQSSVTTPVQARHCNSRSPVVPANSMNEAPANSSQTASFPSSYTDVQSSVTTPVQARHCNSRSFVAKKSRESTPRERIKDSCGKRIELLNFQIEAMRKEHEKELELKDLKICIMKEKLKYWKNMNKNKDDRLD